LDGRTDSSVNSQPMGDSVSHTLQDRTISMSYSTTTFVLLIYSTMSVVV